MRGTQHVDNPKLDSAVASNTAIRWCYLWQRQYSGFDSAQSQHIAQS